jgi:hypothetical protein
MIYILKTADKNCLEPFLKMYLIYVCSGMSHVQAGLLIFFLPRAHSLISCMWLQDAIRSSSLKLLDDIVPLHPVPVALCAAEIFPIYIHMLSGGEGSSKTDFEGNIYMPGRKKLRLRTMSMSARMGILTSLEAYLKAFIALRNQSARTQATPDTACQQEARFCAAWSPDVRNAIAVYRQPASHALGAAQLGDASGGADGLLEELVSSMLPLLLQCWGECVPSAPESRASLDAMLQTLDLFLLIIDAAPRPSAARPPAQDSPAGASAAAVGQVCRALMAGFPFDGDRIPPSSAAGAADVRRLNLGVCGVVTAGLEAAACGADAARLRGHLLLHVRDQLLAAAGQPHPRGKSARDGRAAGGGGAWETAARLVGLLGRLVGPGGGGGGGSVEEWDALEAFTACLEAAPAGSALHDAGLALVRRALADWPRGATAHTARWLQHVPKLLWTLGGRHPRLSRDLLVLLAGVARAAPASPAAAAEVAGLQALLVPFFRTKLRR